MSNICAPHKYDPNNKTCFTIEQLLEMANAYNRYLVKNNFSPQKNHINANLIKIKKDKSYLLKELLSRFKNICQDDQVCLTKQSFMNEIVKEMHDEFSNHTFRPVGPADPTQWLGTSDIDYILKQYEKIHPQFLFLGAVPLDCNDYSFCQLHQLDFDEIQNNGKKYVGIIFNHDKYGQPGSHWVALYIDFLKGEINYADSTGKEPVGNIKTIIQDFNDYFQKKYHKKPLYTYNNIKYQKDNSECGIYSINFIIRRLSGEKFESVIKNSLSFKEINSCRNVYFRNMPSSHKPVSLCDPKI